MNKKQRNIINSLLIALACVVAFAPFINGPFMYDDEAIITQNPYIRDIRSVGQFFTVRYWNEIHPGTTGVFRPLRETTFTFLYAAFGPNPLAFHSVSLLTHIAVAILLYFMALKLLKGDETAGLIAALLFAVHPTHVEAVLWAKNLAELLAALLVIGAFLLFIRALRYKTSELGFKLNVAGAAILYALALTCKESGLALPLVMLLYIFFALPKESRRKALIAVAPMVVLAGAYMVFQFTASQLISATIEGQRRDPDEALALRPALVSKTYAFYYRLLILPVMLCAQYHFIIPVSYTGPEALPYLLGFVALTGAIAAGLYYRREYAWLILWPVLFLGPASNIIPFRGRPVGDQRLYVPSIGFCLLIGLLFSAAMKLRARRWARSGAWAAAGVICANMLLLTMLRGPVWLDEERFWLDMFIKSPVQAEAHFQVGQSYWERGRVPEALEHADRCVDGNPEHYRGYLLMGQSLGSLGQHEEAIEAFEKVLELAPGMSEALVNMGIAYMNLGRFDLAVEAFERSLAVMPNDPETHIDLAGAYLEAGRTEDARRAIRRALEIEPRSARALYIRGVMAAQEDRIAEAMDSFMAAVQIEPGNPVYLTDAARAAMMLNQRDLARSLLQRALSVAPDYPPAVEMMRELMR